jgi:hypothetical protein
MLHRLGGWLQQTAAGPVVSRSGGGGRVLGAVGRAQGQPTHTRANRTVGGRVNGGTENRDGRE